MIQGFGAVDKHARFLAECGAVLIGASDSAGAIHEPAGVDVARLIMLKNSGGSVGDHGSDRRLDRDAVLDIECDIWIPAARPDVVREDNVHRLKARLVLQGANIPFTDGAEQAHRAAPSSRGSGGRAGEAGDELSPLLDPLNRRTHGVIGQITPWARPTSTKAARARSRCIGSWAALI